MFLWKMISPPAYSENNFQCQVALDAIEELCTEMGLQRLEALDEYAVFLVTHRGNLLQMIIKHFFHRLIFCHVIKLLFCIGQNVRPLNKREYILDIATEAEPVDPNYSFWFRRVIWSLALKLDNELYVNMHYNQVPLQCLHLSLLHKSISEVE